MFNILFHLCIPISSWRFESLKSRCVLIDRENLLTEHKIGFKPMQAMEFNIKEAELKAALPRIVSVAPSSPSKSAQLSDLKTTSISLPKPTEIILLDTPIKPAVKEEVVEPLKPALKPALKETPVIVKQESKETEIKPMTNSTPIKTIMGVKIKREVNLNLEHSVHVNIKKETAVNTEMEESEIIPNPQMKGTPVKPDFSLIKIESNEGTPINLSETEEDDQKTSETPAKPLMKGTPIKQRLGGIKVKSNEILLETPAKPQRKGTPVKLIKLQAETEDSGEESFKETSLKPDEIDCVEVLDRTAPQKPQRKGTPVKIPVIKDGTNSNVRSILSKKREVFAEDSQKAVKFSANDPIVHNLSPLERCQSKELAKENTKPTETEESNDIKPTIKRPNIIRRIVLSSRKPTMK